MTNNIITIHQRVRGASFILIICASILNSFSMSVWTSRPSWGFRYARRFLISGSGDRYRGLFVIWIGVNIYSRLLPDSIKYRKHN